MADVSSTTSCSSPVSIETASIRISARISATATGCAHIRFARVAKLAFMKRLSEVEGLLDRREILVGTILENARLKMLKRLVDRGSHYGRSV